MGKGSSTTTSSNAPSATAQAGYNTAASDAQSAASNPYQYYPGQMVANLTPQQLTGMSEVNNATGIANPYINAAATMTQAGTQPIGASQINQYMNPYLGDVASTTSAEINQNNAIQQNQLQGNAAALGALGGNRVGTAQSQLANQQDLAENQAMSSIYEGGYNTALGAAQTTNAQQLQGGALMGSLGTEAQNTALAGANAQLAAGSTAQTQQQNELNAAYSQWAGAQQYPYQSAEYLSNIMEGIGSLEGGTGATTTPPPSEFSQIVGGLGSVIGLAGAAETGGQGGGSIFRKGGRVTERAVGGPVNFDGGGGVVPSSNALGAMQPGYFPSITGNSGVASTLPPPPAPAQPQKQSQSGGVNLKTGGRAGYDLGGSLPYGNSQEGYFPSISESAPHGNSLPKPPPASTQNSANPKDTTADGGSGVSGGTNSTATQAVQAAQGIGGLISFGDQIINGQQGQETGGLAPSQASTFISAPGLETTGSLVNPNQNYTVGQQGQQYGFAHGGRIARATGGTSGSATPESGISTSISPSAPSTEEEMENYSMMASLMPGAQPPAYHYGNTQTAENPVSAEEQSEGQEMATGGIARVKRAAGGAGTAQSGLASFQPVGGQAMNAPQPTSTAGTQPSTWGNVTLPTAPQLSTAPVAQMTPASINASIALPSGGTQNNYAGYIESLPGSNPSIGNVSPAGKNTYGAPAQSTTGGLTAAQIASLYGSEASSSTIGLKTGGRAHRDIGGQTDYQVDGDATPLSGQAPGVPVGPIAPPVVPVQSAPLPAPSAAPAQPAPQPTPAPANPVPGLGAVATPPVSAPAQGIAAAKTAPAAPQGVAAVAPQPAAPQGTVQPPINNPGNLKVPGVPNAFQQFATPIAGMDAMTEQLTVDNKPLAEGGHGLDTLTKLISSWAPSSENDTSSYIKNVSTETGIDPNAPLDLSDPKTMAAVQSAMIGQEQGKKASGYTQVAQNDVSQPSYVNGQVASDASGGFGYLNPSGATQGNAGIPNVSSDPNAGPQTEQEHLANNPWLALAAAGFATMAGTSPYAAVNIGQGGLAGIQYLQGIQGQQRAQAATQQAQTGLQQTGAGQRLQAQQQQNAYTIGLINEIPGLTDAQRNAIGFNNYAAQNGLPQQPVPGNIPPGLPPQIAGLVPGYSGQQTAPQGQPAPAMPQTTTGAVGGAGPSPVSYNPQGQAVISPTFAQNATGLVPSGQSSVDTTTLGPNAQPMPYRAAFQRATQDLGSNYAPAVSQGQAWMTQYGPAAQQQAAQQLQQVATAGAAQSSQLDELQSEAANIHTGPVTGPVIASAVKTIQDVGGLFGIDTSGITDASNAAQVIPKLSTTLLAAAGKMASDQGGYEALRMMQSSVPTISNTGTGVQQIVQIYNTMNQRAQALASYTNNVVTQGVGTVQMAAASFNQMYPPDMWASRVAPLPVPGSVGSMKPGYTYQTGGQMAIWNGSGWAPAQ